MLAWKIMLTNSFRFFSSPYNVRFHDWFKDAYSAEPLLDETNSSKNTQDMNGDFGIGSLR